MCKNVQFEFSSFNIAVDICKQSLCMYLRRVGKNKVEQATSVGHTNQSNNLNVG